MTVHMRPMWVAREFPVGLALVVVVVGTTLVNTRFMSPQGRTDLLVAVAITALMAVGQTFVIVMKHVDLSVGSTLGLSAYFAAIAVRGQETGGVFTVLLVGLVVGIAVGVVNGALVAVLRLPALVVTLGTLYVIKGIQAVLIGPRRINVDQLPSDVVDFGRSTLLGVPHLMWLCLLVGVLGGWFLRTQRQGRDLYAIGSNGPAARLVGIPVWRREVLAFVGCGASAGLAGALYLARFGGVDANAGSGYELPVVAACVVGGVAITGGVGTVLGALLGAALLKTIGGSLSALSVPEFWQQAVNGALLLLAIAVDKVINDRRTRQVTVVQEVPAARKVPA
jgi:rhamnose transport system permease protein